MIANATHTHPTFWGALALIVWLALMVGVPIVILALMERNN